MEIRATTTLLASFRKVEVHYNDVKLEALKVFFDASCKEYSARFESKGRSALQ